MQPGAQRKLLLAMWTILILAIVIGLIATVLARREASAPVMSFAQCAARYPVMESFPRQCNTPDGKHFVEGTASVIEPPSPAPTLVIRGSAADMVRNVSPAPNGVAHDPLIVTGEARLMYFEASFPVMLIDGVGTTVAEGHAEAQGDWMTEEFVPFRAEVAWKAKPVTSGGTLILKKDNPSGLPEHDREAYIAIHFKGYESLPEGAD